MLRMPLVVLFCLFLSTGCGGSDSDTASVPPDNNQYECFPGNAPLPPNTLSLSEGLVTPPGYHYSCDLGDTMSFHSNGRVTGTVSDYDYPETLAYWQQCRLGPRPPRASGTWTLSNEYGLCVRNDWQPGVISCYSGSYRSDSFGILSFTLLDIEFYDENGDYIGGEELLATPFIEETCNLRED